jgi:hypothetical protein
MVTYVTDRPGGFSVSEVADLTLASQRLPVLVDMHSQKRHLPQRVQCVSGRQDGSRLNSGVYRDWQMHQDFCT